MASEHKSKVGWTGRLRCWRCLQARAWTDGHGDDNSWFTLLTQNTAALHFDNHYASHPR